MSSTAFPSASPHRPRPVGFAADFLTGMHDVFRGFTLLARHRAWWLWALLPLCINLALFGFALWFGFSTLQGYVHRELFSAHSHWLDALGWLVYVFYWVVLLFISYYSFVLVGTLIASPFNDLLSEKVELDYCGEQVSKTSILRDTTRAIWIGLKVSLRLMFKALLLFLLILPLNFIPVAGAALFFILSNAIAVWFLSLQFTTWSMDRRFYTYAQRKDFMRRNRARMLGLGTASALLMWIPIINALFISASAVAGTLLFCDAELKPASRRTPLANSVAPADN